MAIIGFLVFASASAASIFVLWSTLVPALPRIVAILRHGVDPDVALQTIQPTVISEGRVRARIQTMPPLARPERRAAA